ncbi:MAG: leucine-rich repeat domain-containing protein [Bacteroidales bacterium]|nr:leucine-rich repeat domain-containing protein [Bacteroidales bacterium]
MKKLFTLFLTLFVASSVWADDYVEREGIKYRLQRIYDAEKKDFIYIAYVSSNDYSGSVTTIDTLVNNNGYKYSVIAIDREAFEDCTGLTSITIPNSVTSIGYGAFANCTRLTSVTIPNSVEKISSSAFSNCISLTSITIPESVTSIGEGAFGGCKNLTSVNMNRVETIGEGAFKGCTSLTSITIPESVTSIGRGAFEKTGLKSITIACNLMNCKEMMGIADDINDATVTILSSVTSINPFQYIGFGQGISIYFEGMEPPVFYEWVYDEYDLTYELKECEECDASSMVTYGGLKKVSVPCEAIETYKEKWPNIADMLSGQPDVWYDKERCTIQLTLDCPNYIMEVVPAPGYRFVEWNDGNTDIKRIVAVGSKKSFRARVEPIDNNNNNNNTNTAISEISNAKAITIVNGQILVNDEAPAFVETVSGQKIANANLKSGVYFVVVDGEMVKVMK